MSEDSLILMSSRELMISGKKKIIFKGGIQMSSFRFKQKEHIFHSFEIQI